MSYYNQNTVYLGTKLPVISNGNIKLTPAYYQTIMHAREVTLAPEPIILSSMLAAMSQLCQGLIDVKKPSGQTVPVSMYFLTIAESGERKSTVHNYFWSEINRHDQQEQIHCKNDVQRKDSLLAVWEQKHKQLSRGVAQLDFDEVKDSEVFQQLLAHEQKKPKPAAMLRLIYDDATSSALFLGIHKNSKNAGLVSSEGGSILNGNTLRDLPKINGIWSGDNIVVDRSSTESFSLVDARLTIAIMIQKAAFDKYVMNHGDEAKGIGLWARFMICKSYSTQGSRFIDNYQAPQKYNWFNDRVIALLAENKTAFTESTPRKVLEFDQYAQQNWINWFNFIESNVRQGGGLLESVPDYASKMADNAARLAALLHYFENGDSQPYIDSNTLDTAISICQWYAAEFVHLRLLPEQADRDIQLLQDWLHHIINGSRTIFNPHLIIDQQHKMFILKRNFLRQYAPNPLRERERLNKALREMQALGIIQLWKGADKVNYVSLASDIFGSPNT